MAFTNRVGNKTGIGFGNIVLASAVPVSLAATGNSVVVIPVEATSYIIRRITVSNPANIAGGSVPNMSTANVSILTSSDGNTSNAVAALQTIGNVTAANTYQDLTLAAGTLTTAYTAGALFVRVGVAVANASVQIEVFGDVVNL